LVIIGVILRVIRILLCFKKLWILQIVNFGTLI
jgi:hypothetical protein